MSRMLGSIAAICVPALSVTPVSSVPGPDPPPGEKHRESSNDGVEWRHHIMKRRHLDLEPIDQTCSAERGDPSDDERRESPAEERSPGLRLQRLGDCHALMYGAMEVLSEKKSPEDSSLRRLRSVLASLERRRYRSCRRSRRSRRRSRRSNARSRRSPRRSRLSLLSSLLSPFLTSYRISLLSPRSSRRSLRISLVSC